MIRHGLKSGDPSIRELALAAVVSRAAGEKFAPNSPAASDWNADRLAIQELRAPVIGALQDPVDAVHVQAVSAIASLDYDISSHEVKMSSATAEVLVHQFYIDKSAPVRASIVGGFGTDRDASNNWRRRWPPNAIRKRVTA